MGLIFGILSVFCCLVGWLMAAKARPKASWAVAGSFACVALTLFFLFYQVSHWVSQADWTALQDVMPTVFPLLVGYIIVLFLGNLGTMIVVKRHQGNEKC